MTHIYQPFPNPRESFRIRTKTVVSPLAQISHYTLGEPIGKGGFATVYRATQNYTQSEVAIKVISLQHLSKQQISRLRTEVDIHKKLNHPNIVRIYEVIWAASKLYIVMQLIKGKQLFEHLSDFGSFPEQKTVKFFSQIVSAVHYLHSLGISHRDIKTQNIIISEDSNAKLIDFGLAKQFNVASDNFFETFCGSPSYVAPEIAQRKRYSGKQIDVWCLGVTLYVMFEVCLPFDSCGDLSVKQNIKSLRWHKPLKSCSQAVDIYQRIFKERKQRINLDELIKHRLFSRNNIDLDELCKKNLTFSEMTEGEEEFISETADILGISQNSVKLSILQSDLGPAYCIFQILKSKKLGNSWLERKINLTPKIRTPYSNRKLRKTIGQNPEKTLKSTDNSRKGSLIKVLPVLRQPSKQKFFFIDTIETKTSTNTPRMSQKRQKFKGQMNFIERGADIKFAKPRLREESPESPKRLIDCIKKYN